MQIQFLEEIFLESPGNTTQGFWALVLNGLRGMLSAMYMMYVNIFEFVLQRLT